MIPFEFDFHGEKRNGNYHLIEKEYGCIKVFFHDHSAIILRSGIQTKAKKEIWVQHVHHGAPVWPNELIQALGEGIDSISG
ncbi:MAG TPA: hypothetical protein VII28_05470 [Puia sp.]